MLFITAKELRICGRINDSNKVCCTSEMEIRLQNKAREKHDRVMKDTLQRLQNILHTRAIKFHGKVDI